ncbi:MAG: hypothetical protein MJ184_06505 [Treponema sp.]|uniref:hypothetical protein n=1 Tax=Treponema sp. TaxID=166 RepID=UPI00298D61EC|nr:hypothetical protein [Treponema sp.]MCQ2600995.1 hypothetical protein [Treponema sp.]
MLDMALLVNGINSMATNCPTDGNVSVIFSVSNGRITSVKLSKICEIYPGTAEESKALFFTDDLKQRILKDVDNQRLQYGTITVSIDAQYGSLKNYSIVPSFTLNANLLAAEMRSQKNRQLAKRTNQVA